MNNFPKPKHTDRETARKVLTIKRDSLIKALADPHHFSTIDPNFLLADTEHRLRWIDCAPEGANHLTAPLQDKTGTPCGSVFTENVGPCKASRESGDRLAAKNGVEGGWQGLKTNQAIARAARASRLEN